MIRRVLRTERLLLRPLREDDLAPLHALFSDPVTMRYWDRPAWSEIARTRQLLNAFMKDAPDSHLEFGVERDGTLIGRVGMWRPYEIGYILRPDMWGQGLTSEAVAALLTELDARFPEAPEFTAELEPRNIGSARVLEKNGFRCTGVTKANFLYGDSEWCDTAYYVRPGPAAAT